MSSVFRVLVVCSANVFRSPFGEFRLREALRRTAGDWHVSSAGVMARDGLPLDQRVARLLRVTVPPDWHSQRLVTGLITDSDLILTADRSHRAAVAVLDPAAARRTWTLRQFARAAGHVPAGSVHDGWELVGAVQHARAQLQPVDPVDEDVLDPARAPRRMLKPTARAITEAAASITAPIARRT